MKKSVPKPSAKYSVLDVANHLIKLSDEVGEPLTNMKLQKLLYYSYAWYLVEKESLSKLFPEKIVAWQYGPVVVEAYNIYKKYCADIITKAAGKSEKHDLLERDVRELIKEVFLAYADKTAIQLMHLTHAETPWLKTYDANDLEKVIPDELIYQFYLEKKKTSLTE